MCEAWTGEVACGKINGSAKYCPKRLIVYFILCAMCVCAAGRGTDVRVSLVVVWGGAEIVVLH